ncbi:MAG: hypothetical protein KAR35_09000, partial [Candidatus Heimdallarchaeota archaeon]|nr:hypothetical protein [Candidatus Heimdallarchaeota archaeon]MCK5049493.1 hypothetical protein [Candidatus Heimdallarchaeota archaeon]
MTVDVSELSFQFLKKKEANVILDLGETILGVPKEELGKEFVIEADGFLDTIDDFQKKDFHILLWLVNSRIAALFFGKSLKRFAKMDDDAKEVFLKKWMLSRLPLLRIGYVAFRALCGWSYYSLEKSWPEMDYPGETIGREHETPTLLFGKKPWQPPKDWKHWKVIPKAKPKA